MIGLLLASAFVVFVVSVFVVGVLFVVWCDSIRVSEVLWCG